MGFLAKAVTSLTSTLRRRPSWFALGPSWKKVFPYLQAGAPISLERTSTGFGPRAARPQPSERCIVKYRYIRCYHLINFFEIMTLITGIQ